MHTKNNYNTKRQPTATHPYQSMAVAKKCIMMASMLISLYLSHYIVLTVWGYEDCVDTLFAGSNGLWVTMMGAR